MFCSTRSRSMTGTGVSRSVTSISTGIGQHCDAIDLDLYADKLAADGCASRRGLGKKLSIDLVPLGEARDIAEIGVDLNDLGHAAAGTIQYRAEIGERLAHLLGETVRLLAGRGINGALAGDKDEAIR